MFLDRGVRRRESILCHSTLRKPHNTNPVGGTIKPISTIFGPIQTKITLLGIIFISFDTTPRWDRADKPSIRIGIIGDQTGSADLSASYDILNDGVAVLQGEPVDVVIHVGDLLESSATEREILTQWQTATAILDTLPVEWFMVAGDHDVNPPVYQQDSRDRSREALWQRLYGSRVSTVRDHPWYSFDRGGCHFIMLYSHQALHADPRWGNIFLARIYRDQLRFLEQDLVGHAAAEATVVFIHQPLWYHTSGWEPVHQLLKRFGVKAVVSGHFHYDQKMPPKDGIRYFTVGATGGDVKEGARDAGNVHHVSVLEVDGKRGVSLTMLPVHDALPLAMTPRRDMDRVQAMDMVLGELWNFAAENSVFLKDGHLVDACENGAPAAISLTSIGNPLDKSMRVQLFVVSDAPEIETTNLGFLPGQCDTVIDDNECILARSARIFLSNYSSVGLNTSVPALWRATLGLNGMPTFDATITFGVRLSFNGAQGEMHLSREVNIPVLSCP